MIQLRLSPNTFYNRIDVQMIRKICLEDNQLQVKDPNIIFPISKNNKKKITNSIQKEISVFILRDIDTVQINISLPKCDHKYCNLFREKQLRRSSKAIFIHNNQYILGKQNDPRFKGQYNVLGGKFNDGENCYKECLTREIKEELKYDINKNFDIIFKKPGTKSEINYIIHRSTPIFIGNLKYFSLKKCNDLIKKDLKNLGLSSDYKEIEHCDYFRNNDKKAYKISQFAYEIIIKMDEKIIMI